MDSREYLETIVAESYRAELEHEENVIRSLPFVAGALAVLATALSFARSYLPNLYPIIVYALMVGLGIAVLIVITFLLIALGHARRYEYISSGAELRAYREDLIAFYQNTGVAAAQVDGQVLSDMRETIIDQYIVGSMHNRMNNERAAAARNRAFTSLVAALAIAFALVGAISLHEAIWPPSDINVIDGI